MRFNIIIATTILVVFNTLPVMAQPAVIKLAGRVTDATNGKPLKGVTVGLKSAGLKLDRVLRTNESGEYRFSNLPPGSDYEVTFQKLDYQSATRKGIALWFGNFTPPHVDAALVPMKHVSGGDEPLKPPVPRAVSRAGPVLAGSSRRALPHGATPAGAGGQPPQGGGAPPTESYSVVLLTLAEPLRVELCLLSEDAMASRQLPPGMRFAAAEEPVEAGGPCARRVSVVVVAVVHFVALPLDESTGGAETCCADEVRAGHGSSTRHVSSRQGATGHPPAGQTEAEGTLIPPGGPLTGRPTAAPARQQGCGGCHRPVQGFTSDGLEELGDRS